MSRKVLLYIWLLTSGALFLLAVTASKIQSVAWSSFLFFILVALLVEFLPIELPTGQHLTLSAAVGITILTNYGWPMAIWVATISVLLDGFAGYTVLLVFLFILQRIFQTYFKLFRATEEKRSELEAVLNATESGILMVDTGGKVRIINRRIEEIFGHSENCPLGLDHAAAQSGPPNAEFETHLTGGVRKIIRRFSSPVVNKDGQLLGTVLSFTDITAEREAALRLQELQHASIRALVAAVDARDPYTHGHSERVSEYAVLLAREIGLPDQEVEVIRYAALLHDIGKIGLNDHILRKSSPLDLEERALVI